ncbi:phosphoglycerate mutase family protein, partial [Listeria ivanovii FSL F6-596]
KLFSYAFGAGGSGGLFSNASSPRLSLINRLTFTIIVLTTA